MIDNAKRILIIDDNVAIHSDFRRTLLQSDTSRDLAAVGAALFDGAAPSDKTRPSYRIDSALQGEEGLSKVQEALSQNEPYSLAFVDMRMPAGWDGLETIQHLWQVDPDIQVVICTAYSDYSWDEIIAALGTTDQMLILKKPFDTCEVRQLATALTGKWSLKRAVQSKLADLERIIHERTSELRIQALQDKLTELPNRACFSELLTQAVRHSREKPDFKFALHFMDCDGFKDINDSLGHEYGDAMLVSIAQRLRQVIGPGAGIEGSNAALVAARLGGDEFIILQTGLAAPQEASALAQRLLDAIAVPHDLHGTEVQCTASIGIALSDTGPGHSEDYLRNADIAMYRAKAAGKGRYLVYTPQMHDAALRRLAVEAELRHAVGAATGFHLVFQPILSLNTGVVQSLECLVRWTSPTRGNVPPDSFIPVAEETGLIIPLGRWIMENACSAIHDMTAELGHDITMAVNVSRRQLVESDIVGLVADCLQRFNLRPAQLILEITESIMLENERVHKEILPRLCALGVQLHMDDFGTGYSSLSCLHQFPIRALKIDRSFIKTATNRRDYISVINAIIQLAHNLNIHVVAEGIETLAQAAALQALECDYGQGYLFAKPLPRDKVLEFILQANVNPSWLAEDPPDAARCAGSGVGSQ